MRRLTTAGVAGPLSLALAVAVAACSAGAAASPTATATPSPVVPASAGLVLPSLGSSDTQLEKLIPDSVGAITLQKFSMRGDEFIASANASDETKAFLDSLGASPADVAVAFGYGADPSTQAAVAVFVFHAPGAGSDRLLSVFRQSVAQSAASPATYTWQSGSVGGKSVQVGSDSTSAKAKIYLYATNDDLFFVSASTEAQVAIVLGGLP